jgi:DNA-binding transcriptional LysR family regulator
MDSDIRAFVRAVERGSFTAAAADLGLTPSAISKLIKRIEERLGVRLLYRTTRRLALTAEGEVYYTRVRDILEAIDDAEAEVANAERPRGRLRINCVSGFAYHELSRVLPAFCARYPEVQVELAVTDRVVDLLVENADIGIRSGEVADPALVARKIVDFERILYAAPGYLARRGAPRTPHDLEHHDCVVNASKAPYFWPFLIGGKVVEVEIKSRLAVDNAETALRIALADGGITRIAELLVGDAVRAARLVPVLAEFHAPDPVPLSAVYLKGRHPMLKVRAFLDFLTEHFAHGPWRRGGRPPQATSRSLP